MLWVLMFTRTLLHFSMLWNDKRVARGLFYSDTSSKLSRRNILRLRQNRIVLTVKIDRFIRRFFQCKFEQKNRNTFEISELRNSYLKKKIEYLKEIGNFVFLKNENCICEFK